MIPAGFLQDLISRVDIVEVVGRHVELKRGGANMMGLCPFHSEKSASFSVSPAKQFYHCFGCGASGDAIRFLIEHSGMSFLDAVEELAQKVGMQVPQEDVSPEERVRRKKLSERRLSLTEVLQRAADFYRTQLRGSTVAIDYFKQRGLTGDVAARFGLGWAPDGWRSLASCFAQYDEPLLEEAGLVRVQDDGGSEGREGSEAERKRYDWFRARVMFPIRSVQGEVIGFGGRVLDDSKPKYMNSPETPVFSKGRELYGLFEGRQAIREHGFALVVEGYMDVVALAQTGFANAVATLGTACTTEHVQKLFRFTDAIVFSFDGDAAGRRAATRALEASLPHVGDLRSVKFLFLPPEHDPDSFVRERGAEAFKEAIDQAVPMSRHLLELASDGAALDSAEGRARLVAQAKPLWDLLAPSTLRDQVLGDIAEHARMSREDLARRWGQTSPRRGDGASRSAHSSGQRNAFARPNLRATARLPHDQVARILLQRCDWWDELSASDHTALVELSGWHADLFRWVDRWHAEHGPTAWAALREAVAAEPWGEQALALVDGAEVPVEPLLEDLRVAITQALRAAPLREAMVVLGRR